MRTGEIIISAVVLVLLALALAPLATAQVPAWSTETVDSTGLVVGWQTSIALDSAGYPHISYFNYTGGDLQYAKWNGSAWSIETVDSAGSVGRQTSIALDSTGYPHISYFNSTDQDLKYARWTGIAWSIETVDSAGFVGAYTSIALDSAGYPHISYFNFTGGDLKYAFILGTPTIVTLQGKLTDSTTGSPVQTGSMRVTIKDSRGFQVWQNTFNNSLFDGVFNIPLGAVQELMLIPDLIYSMEVEIDADSAAFVAADVTFGDNVPAGDVIKFKA